MPVHTHTPAAMHSRRSSSPCRTSMELDEPVGDSQVGAASDTVRAVRAENQPQHSSHTHTHQSHTHTHRLTKPVRQCRKIEEHADHTIILTRQHFNNHGHLLLDDVLVGETGVTAVISGWVIEQDVREVEVSVDSHGNPAVLPHSLHGGERRLDGPAERSRVWAWDETWCWDSRWFVGLADGILPGLFGSDTLVIQCTFMDHRLQRNLQLDIQWVTGLGGPVGGSQDNTRGKPALTTKGSRMSLGHRGAPAQTRLHWAKLRFVDLWQCVWNMLRSHWIQSTKCNILTF